MANNGYLVGGVCTGDIFVKFISSCPSGSYNFYSGYLISTGSQGGGTCYNSAGSPVYSVSKPSFDCEILGPSLTETQQIEAINGLFPYVVAIIAAAWACRFIIGLVNAWLKETRTDHD